MIFQIDPIELIRVLRQLKLNPKAKAGHVWIETDKYNEVTFSGQKAFVRVNSPVIKSGKIRINASDLAYLKNSIKLNEDKVEFITEDPFLLIKQGTFVLKFNYLTQWLEEQRKNVKQAQNQAAKELTNLNKQLKAFGKKD